MNQQDLLQELERLREHNKNMQKLFHEAMTSSPPRYLCKSCREDWQRAADAQKHFVKQILEK